MTKDKSLKYITMFLMSSVIIFPLINICLIYPNFSKLMIEHTTHDAIKAANHLKRDAFNYQNNELTYDSHHKDDIQALLDDLGVMKVKLFSKSGKTIFSTDQEDIGTLNTKDYFHNVVANGKTYTKVVVKNTESLEGQKLSKDVVEVYVPILIDDKFVGAFEIYYDITQQRQHLGKALSQAQITILLLAAASFVIMAVALLKASRNAKKREYAEKILRESEEKFRTVIDVSKDAMIAIDSTANVTMFNPAAEKMFGYNREDIIGSTVTRLMPEEYRNKHDNGVREYFKKGQGHGVVGNTVEMVALGSDGTTFPIEMTFSPSRQGKEQFVLSIIRDITERKLFEVSLQNAKEASESANKAKDEFLANMSHEIRTPLNAIIGFSEGIIVTDSIQTAHERANTVLRESEHLLALINEVLDHAKIEAGKITLEYLPLDLSALLKSALGTVEKTAHEKDIELNIVITEEVPPFIINDPLRLRQILINLINNSVKFTKKGSVSIHVEPVNLQDDLCNLKFSVIDTGIGIPKDRQEAIFDSFTQADGSTTRKFGGTGLGTSISKKIVEMMHGQIGLESELGKGSTFWFTIPCQICDKPSGIEQDSMLSESSKSEIEENTVSARILVAEDYEPNQDVAKMHLEMAGHTIDIAVDGRQAVKMCEKKSYDLIFMDIQMPELDGFDATRRIRKGNSLCSDIPIIGLTASTSSDTKQECLEAGMNDVIHKPIRCNQLLNTANKWLGLSNKETLPELDDNKQNTKCQNAPMDFEEAVKEFAGNRELVHTVIEKFLNISEEQIRILKEALDNQDNETIRKEAHKIRGGAANLTAMPLALVAENLEEIALSGTLDEACDKIKELEDEFVRLKQFV